MASTENRSRRTLFVVIALAAIAAVAVAALLVNIFTRKQEARNQFARVVEVTDDTADPAQWGKNWPQHYDQYLKTVDQQRTRYGGSEALPRVPSEADPRSTIARSKIEEDPRLKSMWAGYAFSKDYREKRGHAYMLTDQEFTERQKVVKQPGTCLNCHASTYTIYKQLGGGDIFKGFEAMNKMPYFDARKYAQHPVACIDCHDPKDMSLRITRPAFLEGIKVLKASQGVKDYDVTKASRQEMRSFVCGQCHVEYYFKGDEKRLTYPWHNGAKVENIVKYYEEVGFKDWTHAETGAQVLKAQHPEFEMWQQGVHARSGVACADCHMPYMREGGMKISDHHVRSPLLNVNRACQTCHRWPEEELKARAEEIQSRFLDTKNEALDALMDLVSDLKAAKGAGATEEQLKDAYQYQKRAQFYIDFVVSENSMGFHADQYAVKTLADSLNFVRLGQNSLRKIQDPKIQQAIVNAPPPVRMPQKPEDNNKGGEQKKAAAPGTTTAGQP